MMASVMPSGLVLMALCLLALPARSASIQASQSVSVYREGSGDGAPGETTIGYTSLGTSGLRWRWRAALSWWRWQPEGATDQAMDSGLGALNLTLGRSLWSYHGTNGSSRGWAQVKGAIPLISAPTPVSSGRFDWGLSLLGTNRFRDFLVLVELGYLNPGDPVGTDYISQFSGALSASWRRRGLPVYPVSSFVSASPIVDGSPSYEEWSAGLGALLGGRAGVLALYSHGTNAGSPGRGLTAVLTLRL